MDKADKHNSVDYYFDDINRCKPLTQDQINEKINQIKALSATDPAIITLRDEVIKSQLKLVIRFAKEYQKVGVPLADLIQEGNIGLIRAIEKYDPAQGLKFGTYAVWWIKQGFLKVIKQSSKLIRMPTHVQESLARIEKLRAAYEREIGCEPTMEYLAEQEGMTEEELEKLYNVSMDPISFEYMVQGESPKNLKDFLPDPNVDLDKDVDSSKLADDLTTAFNTHLTPEEKEVMILRYGLCKEMTHTLEESGASMSKSREHIRQLESSALAKLKQFAPELEDYRE
jgi:RNA polymerase primary sigma factor